MRMASLAPWYGQGKPLYSIDGVQHRSIGASDTEVELWP